jgi:hypothetical protein
LGGNDRAVADIDIRGRLEFNSRMNLLNVGRLCHLKD